MIGQSVSLIVSSGIEGLRPENVKVMDNFGNMVSSSGNATDFLLSEQHAQLRRFEQTQAKKALDQLEALLGIGMAQVSVTAEMDFDHATIETITIDPKQKAARREKITSTKSEQSLSTSGFAGIAANLPNGGSTQSSQPLSTSEESEFEYEIGKAIQNEIKPAGTVKRLSIAVVAEVPTPTTDESTGD